jgi:predicted dehydrogenase
MSTTRILINGLGFMGSMHAAAYATIPGASVVGVVDAFPETARARADRAGLAGVPVFATLADALAKTPADIVDICLPTHLHTDACVEALEAGRHVFCEKPLALSLGEIEKIRAARDRSGAFFQVGHVIRFWPEYQAFEAFYRGGSAGRLRSLTLQRRSARPAGAGNWLADPSRSLGAALDLHIHDTDYLLHLLGTPAAVDTRGIRENGAWNHVFTDYRYEGGPIARAEGGWDYPAKWGFLMAFQAVFEEAAVEFDSNASPTLRLVRAGAEPEPLPFVSAGGKADAGGNVSSLGGYINELAAFVACVASGRAPMVATLEDGAESVRVVLAEIASAEKSAQVSL